MSQTPSALTPPPLPEMGPMRPPSPSTPVPQAQPANVPTGRGSFRLPMSGGRGMRTVLGLASGGIGLVAVVLALETIAQPQFRPSHLLGTFEGARDRAEWQERMGADGRPILTEADYQRELAAARVEGERAAELAFQDQLKDLELDYQVRLANAQADTQRVTSAYQTLYQRSNILAQYTMQMQQVALDYRSRAVRRTQGGEEFVGSAMGFLCGLGRATGDTSDANGFCSGASEVRRGMVEDLDTFAGVSSAELSRQIFGGLPDPASLTVSQDIETNGAPSRPLP